MNRAAKGLIGILLLISACSPPGQAERNESLALAMVSNINKAQADYKTQHGRFATSLSELSPFIPEDLATGEKGRYHFALQGSSSGYSITAVPAISGSTGSRTYYSDETFVIRTSSGAAPATAAGPPLQ